METGKVMGRSSVRGVETERIGPALFGCICCALVVHVYGAPCAAILALLYIWKDLRVCLVLESPRAGCAGSPSARHQRNGLAQDGLVGCLHARVSAFPSRTPLRIVCCAYLCAYAMPAERLAT